MKPIIFNTPMVRAILAGEKTQTRRVIDPQPEWRKGKSGTLMADGWSWHAKAHLGPRLSSYPYQDMFSDELKKFCPLGQPGDLLWVRETWCDNSENTNGEFSGISYAADEWDGIGNEDEYILREHVKWRPSIHMPRLAARIFLKIKNIRVERLQDISPQDAWAEGTRCLCTSPVPECAGNIETFREVWDFSRSGRGGYWNWNPWIWVIEFERTEAPA